MILFELFITFLIIGAFTFGGGYSMIALIQEQVVEQQGWLSAEEFTDIVAISQMTPGPVGINTATYAGYTAVANAGYPAWMAVGGASLASLAVIIIPVTLILLVSRWLLAHSDNPQVATVFRILRLAVVGLIAAAALSLGEAVGSQQSATGTIISLSIFLVVFLLSIVPKKKLSNLPPPLSTLHSPLFLILLSGLLGLILY